MALTEVLQHIPGLSELEEQGDLVIVGHTEVYTQDGVFSSTALSRALRKGWKTPSEIATASGYYRGTELDGRLIWSHLLRNMNES